MNNFKALPFSYEAETCVLGSILKKSNCISEVIQVIKTDDFYKTIHKIIYSVFIELYSQDVIIDLITVTQELKKLENLEAVGGITYLTELQESILTVDNIRAYAEIVKEKSSKRKIIEIAKEIMKKAYSERNDTKQIVGIAEEGLCGLILENDDKMTSIDIIAEKALIMIEDNYKRGGGLTGVGTGLTEIDRVTSGLQKQDLIIIAARPSMGKTTLAVNIGDYIARSNNVAIFSLEMSKESLVQKQLSALSMVQYEKIRCGKLDAKEWGAVAESSSAVATLNLHIDDTAGLSVNEIKAKCNKLKTQEGLDVVIVDYLQLIVGNGEKVREQEISAISRGLKRLAKDLDITVIALSQLSRAPEQRVDHRPMLSDLRDSGSIEQDADIVMFIYRDEYYNKETVDVNVAECIIAKQRNGRVGTIKLSWLGQYQRFSNLENI